MSHLQLPEYCLAIGWFINPIAFKVCAIGFHICNYLPTVWQLDEIKKYALTEHKVCRLVLPSNAIINTCRIL